MEGWDLAYALCPWACGEEFEGWGRSRADARDDLVSKIRKHLNNKHGLKFSRDEILSKIDISFDRATEEPVEEDN